MVKKRVFLFFLMVFFSFSEAGKVVMEEYESKPVTVPAKGVVHRVPSRTFTVPVDGYVVQAHWTVLNAPSYLLHHAWALTPEGENYLCKIQGSAIFATGREHHRLLLPAGHPISEKAFGLKVRKGQKFEIGLAVMFHNPDSITYEKVSARLTVLYYVPDPGEQVTELMPLMMNIGPEPHTNANFWCAYLPGGNTSEYWIPPRTTKTDSWKEPLEITKPIKIWSIGVHAHDYAEYVRLLVNGKEAWRAPLVRDRDGHLVEIPFAYDPGITLKPGDKINIEAQYKNPTDQPVDAMAFIFLIHEKTEGAPYKVPEIPKVKAKDQVSEPHHHPSHHH